MDNVISYEILYDILRREKSKPELQKLDKTFFNDFKAYLKEKLLLLESQKQKSSIFAQKEIEKTTIKIQREQTQESLGFAFYQFAQMGN